MTFSSGGPGELGIGASIESMHESRDTTYVIDNSHNITSLFSLGPFTLPQAMWTDATEVTAAGIALMSTSAPLPEVYVPNAAITLKRSHLLGVLASLSADDDEYWPHSAAYDPTGSSAAIKYLLPVDTKVAQSSYGSGSAKVVEKSNTTNRIYRLRAISSNGSFATIAEDIRSSFCEVQDRSPTARPVSELIDATNGNRMCLKIRNATNNRLAGYFLHYLECVSWTL